MKGIAVAGGTYDSVALQISVPPRQYTGKLHIALALHAHALHSCTFGVE